MNDFWVLSGDAQTYQTLLSTTYYCPPIFSIGSFLICTINTYLSPLTFEYLSIFTFILGCRSLYILYTVLSRYNKYLYFFICISIIPQMWFFNKDVLTFYSLLVLVIFTLFPHKKFIRYDLSFAIIASLFREFSFSVYIVYLLLIIYNKFTKKLPAKLFVITSICLIVSFLLSSFISSPDNSLYAVNSAEDLGQNTYPMLISILSIFPSSIIDILRFTLFPFISILIGVFYFVSPSFSLTCQSFSIFIACFVFLYLFLTLVSRKRMIFNYFKGPSKTKLINVTSLFIYVWMFNGITPYFVSRIAAFSLLPFMLVPLLLSSKHG